MITLRSGMATATIEPYGGQVMSYIPAGGEEVLWTTNAGHLDAARKAGKAPRGGVPVCWPWFGPHPTDKAAPVHGLARIAMWKVTEAGPDRAVLSFGTDGSSLAFPYEAEARLEVTLSDALEVTLTTANKGGRPFVLTDGLHTYLRVGDVDLVEILGLEKAVSNKGDKSSDPVIIRGEVDRIYSPVTGELQVVDAALSRMIHVRNAGCTEAVVWNPGSDKADMPAGSFRQMLCVEPANVRDAPTLGPGGSHRLSTRLSVEKL